MSIIIINLLKFIDNTFFFSQTQFGFVTGKISVKFFFKNKNIEDLKDPEKLEEDLQGNHKNFTYIFY